MKVDGVMAASKILVVDDNADNVRFVDALLHWAGYSTVIGVTDSSEAVGIVRNSAPDLVLLDLHMPKPDGYEILTSIRESFNREYLPVLVFTADAMPAARTRALDCGASDFLMKPCDNTELLLRVRNFLEARRMHMLLQLNAIELEDKVRARTAALSASHRGALQALARAGEYRDDDTGEHTRRVGELSGQIARELGLPPDVVEGLQYAAPLHDIGKIGLPDSILLKKGRLEPAEIEAMRRHTIIGGSVLAMVDSDLMRLAREIALAHHEHWDGSGYPYGLAGEAIPLSARIVAVADVYDALTHVRPYKEAWPEEKAIAEIRTQRARHFDPAVTDAFLDLRRDNT